MKKCTRNTGWALVFYVTIVRLFTVSVCSEIITKDIEYRENSTVFEGFLAYDNSLKVKLPGVLIIHEWNGLGSFIKTRAAEIAKLGYIAFCADIYGKGVRPKNREESSQQAMIYLRDRKLLLNRINSALSELKKQDRVDIDRIAAIGYCFGGTSVLELARSGADISGIVSFHGNLSHSRPGDAKKIKTQVLILHGANDKPEQITSFQEEMRNTDTDWQMVIYGGAVHSFTNPASGNDPKKGVAYDAKSNRRSWETMKQFLAEIFTR